ncbi:MAG: asparagine--tRNA ligase [Deltaproteobacteria bacterium]|nr:asparagine--tRNA ligase [Deltaproteobacteria bacterium]
MLGPYRADLVGGSKVITYIGNRVFSPCSDIASLELTSDDLTKVVTRLGADESLRHLHTIDALIFREAVSYFHAVGADWCSLPVTTRMISSPGEVYRGERLNYTTDSVPITLEWFDQSRKIFLSESSQFYLELRLLIPSVNRVFSIYNSFRKEQGDFSHLAEFQHIEFEGKVSFEENIAIALGLVLHLVRGVLEKCEESLRFFLDDPSIEALQTFSALSFKRLTFQEAMEILAEDTQLPEYREPSLKHFGAWEEIRLGQIIGKSLIITHYPLEEIPFYHNEAPVNGKIRVAENADIVLSGYREVIGSGSRISDTAKLAEKARFFNLPVADYDPYLMSRAQASFRQTAGFGLGWQRFTHWLLRLPAIWRASHIPRTHLNPIP